MTVCSPPAPHAASLRRQKQALGVRKSGNLVSVRTPKAWNRVEFFAWLDHELVRAGYPHVTRLAEAAEISPSTISYWRSGKQRPTQDKLTAIAKVLGVPRRELWLKAGIVDTNDVGPSGTTGVPAEDPAIKLIRASKLNKAAKDMLIAQHLEDRRHAEAKLKQAIGMLEDAQS